jgi:hypothetical protein
MRDNQPFHMSGQSDVNAGENDNQGLNKGCAEGLWLEESLRC